MDSLQTVVLEIRDRGTHISALAIKMEAGDNEATDYHIHYRSSYGRGGDAVILIKLETGEGKNSPYSWGSDPRTMRQAHEWIVAHFDELADGDVVDVEFILGEKPTKKISERFL